MKILALDVGKIRIGMALLDGEVIISLPTVDISRQDFIGKILEISRKNKVEKIIIGLPKGHLASEDLARSFAMEINKTFPIPIEYEDETLTSREAERILADLKINPRSKKYKEEIDRISAKLILEQYLSK